MAFYDLEKSERKLLAEKIYTNILQDLHKSFSECLFTYFSDEDTYIRKNAYLAVGKIYKSNTQLQTTVLSILNTLFELGNEKVRQSTINAAGEIGMIYFESVDHLMENGLFDSHHSVRNAVIGSIKKMGKKNPKPVMHFARRFLHHEDKEIRREICHGIELRGRTHPEDILPLLKELQFDKTSRVKNTLIHVLGQISYKQGCIETVIAHLKTWENQVLVSKAIEEIIDVHHRYRDFAIMTQQEARDYIQNNF